jgi:hypothetical protein
MRCDVHRLVSAYNPLMSNRFQSAVSNPSLLWFMTALSLALNVILIGVVVALIVIARQTATDLASQLQAVSDQSISFTIQLTQTVPVRASVPLEYDVNVPVNQSVEVDTVATGERDVPLLGRVKFDVPIKTTIPINFTVPVSITKDVPVEASVPLSLDIPVQIPLRKSKLGAAINALADKLNQVAGR